MNYKETAKGILEHVGGVENISNMSHCATRLRLNLKDETLANDEDVKAVDGVVNVINKAGQYQVLIGIEVPHVFEEFEKLVKGFLSNLCNFRTIITCFSWIRYFKRFIDFSSTIRND